MSANVEQRVVIQTLVTTGMLCTLCLKRKRRHDGLSHRSIVHILLKKSADALIEHLEIAKKLISLRRPIDLRFLRRRLLAGYEFRKSVRSHTRPHFIIIDTRPSRGKTLPSHPNPKSATIPT
jgi:hypothetical protein